MISRPPSAIGEGSALAAEQIAADDPVRDALGRLLLLSSLWIAAAAADRDDTEEQMLEVIERIIWLLTS
jgi:hypothetical protein